MKCTKLDNNVLNNMTEFLKRHFSVSENDKLSCVECKILAEKILSFLPTIEVSDDCISREWVYNALTKVTAVTPTQTDMLSDFTDIIKKAPSVVPTTEQSSKVGEWVESEIPNELYVCSECGGACWSYDCDRTIVKSYFCPNCGAKMKG